MPFLDGNIGNCITQRDDSENIAAFHSLLKQELGQLKDWLDQRLVLQRDVQQSFARETLHGEQNRDCRAELRLLVEGTTAASSSKMSPPQDMTAERAFNEPASREQAVLKLKSTSRAWLGANLPQNIGKGQMGKLFVQKQLMTLFDNLDSEGHGHLDRSELKKVLDEGGMNYIKIGGECEDTRNTGIISRMEWFDVVDTFLHNSPDADALTSSTDELMELNDNLRAVVVKRAGLPGLCLIQHDSVLRLAWDSLMLGLLFYVLLSFPLGLAFPALRSPPTLDRFCDTLFMFDILLNFCTSYVQKDACVDISARGIALHYIKTWFFIDFVASVPWDVVSVGMMPNLQVGRLVRLSKLTRITKLFQFKKLLKKAELAAVFEMLERMVSGKERRTIRKVLGLLTSTCMFCHWLACFLAVVNMEALEDYLGTATPTSSAWEYYVASLYWSMATLCTVGYGDISPNNTDGRLYAIFAMMVGVAFYAYTIGSITAIITSVDSGHAILQDKLDMLEDWLDSHEEQMPHVLRRRIRCFFSEHWLTRPVQNDSQIVGALSRELRADAAFFIIPECVRCNILFYDLHSSAFAILLDVLVTSSAKHHETIVGAGDPGVGMHIILDGSAHIVEGELWRFPGSRSCAQVPNAGFETVMNSLQQSDNQDEVTLTAGDSFGEEVLFNFEPSYLYTIVAASDVKIFEIPLAGFARSFKHLPNLKHHMQLNFVRSRGSTSGAWTSL